MTKDFAKWHELKTQLEAAKAPLFREQEIWWCSLGHNLGTEQDGKNEMFERPVLVIKKFNTDLFWGLPLTSKPKDGKFYVSFPLHDKKRTLILFQVRSLSGQRLIRKISKISDSLFGKIHGAFVNFCKENGPLA